MMGPLGNAVKATMSDLQLREMIIAVSLSVMILWIGLYPSPFLRIMNGSVQALVDRLHHEKTAGLDDNRMGRGF
jgi:NADH-quinone oxidoreductase subunit M